MKHIIVVGGGSGGAFAAKTLYRSGQVKVTLVDRKEYFELVFAQLRAVTDPALGKASRIPYTEILGDSFVHGEVSGVEENAVVLADGTKLAFDLLVLAPGNRYPQFAFKPWDQTTLAAREAYNAESYAKFRDAASYLVVGGGTVGVELAGELAVGGKPVRLVHRGARLTEVLSEKASTTALRHLKAAGVDVALNSSATPTPGELVFEAHSSRPATDFLNSTGVLDPHGRIQVDEFLKVRGHPSWYAFGDGADVPEAKHGVFARMQGQYIAAAILGSATAKPKVPKPYKPHSTLALVPIGINYGFLQAPFGIATWKPLVDMKRKGFFIARTRKELTS